MHYHYFSWRIPEGVCKLFPFTGTLFPLSARDAYMHAGLHAEMMVIWVFKWYSLDT